MLLVPIFRPEEFNGKLYTEYGYVLKHFAKYMTELERLQAELEKTHNQLMEVEKESQERIAELESELKTKDNIHKINLNETIKVKLTPYGAEIYYKQFDDVNKQCGREICKPHMPRIDKDGYTEFQLWHFIELYGEHIGMCKSNVIEPLDIVYCGNDKCHSDHAE